MDLFSIEFWIALVIIVFFDLILAGDNAIVIGLAAKNLPKEEQKKAIILGTLGAVVIRVIATIFVVYLLKIPFLQVAGGLLLIWIAYKLLIQEEEHQIKSGNTLFSAVSTIVIADAAMGIDNVVAVAAAAHGDVPLVIMGLAISIPIIVWCSTLFIKLTERFPFILYIGAGILGYTGSNMLTHDQQLVHFFTDHPILKWMLVVAVIIGVLTVGKLTNDHKQQNKKQTVGA